MQLTFRLLAAAFMCAGAYHLLAMANGAPEERVRHATFALIDVLVGVLMVRRPPGFAIAFALLCGQQLASHGAALAQSLREGHVDVISIVVVVTMPAALALLLIDARKKRATR